ncbi:putative pilus assembly protein FilE [Acinetobacter sp. ANC 5378]|uniref:putative pilus assembly protein FilE n=1 Tax=Acinetobacter sp. ANC 5378 TaxID=2731249 RepID=UPI00202ECD87|nr:putative pilus assembly protein FilE [Acinetobacter sp. ANC 5378]
MKTILTLSLAQVSWSYAGEFHTIIGPDGRPMIIQREPPKVAAAKTNPKPVIVQQQSLPVAPAHEQKASAATSSVQSPIAQITVAAPGKSVKTGKVESSAQTDLDTVKTIEPQTKSAVKLQVAEKMQLQSTPVSPVNRQPIATENQLVLQQPTVISQKVLEVKPVIIQENIENTAFVDIDGQQYVKNEYLEDKEFNLEGKKRFYTMPEGIIDLKHGATRLQTVEREKGVGKSTIQSLFKRNVVQDTGPITLAKTYYRISQADAIDGLGQQCFSEKKLKKVKKLDLNKEVNFWPHAPLNDEFDFEVAALNPSVQNIQLNSYASRQNNPTFYWPFVVFLDAKGCVLEGAGGYKNQEGASTLIQHEKIEGVLHVPANSKYILLTPLASAIDVEDRALTNHGQVKLVAIR